MEKQKQQEQQQKIRDLVEEFCSQKVDKEYSELAKRLTQKLGRKKVVPFMSGKQEIWAGGIIHAIGTINFLFDKSFEPYISAEEINDFFGTSKSSVGTNRN